MSDEPEAIYVDVQIAERITELAVLLGANPHWEHPRERRVTWRTVGGPTPTMMDRVDPPITFDWSEVGPTGSRKLRLRCTDDGHRRFELTENFASEQRIIPNDADEDC
jgi:hypothetical protein